MNLDIITERERSELLRLIRRAYDGAPTNRIEAVASELEQIYVEARVAGLCEDGALEVVRDEIRQRQATVPASGSVSLG